MIKLLLAFILIFVVAFSSQAQQVPQYSQWFWHLQALNPAFSGIKPCLEIKTLYRNQWANIPGSPNSGFITLNLPISTPQKKLLSPRQGIGFKFETDKIGAFSMNRFLVNYAAHFNFTPETRLSIGISGGVKQWVFDRDKMTTFETDPVLQQSASFIRPDAALGAWWNGKNYFLSFSMSELIRSKWNPLTADSRYQIHSYFGAGTRFTLNEKFTLLPYILLRFPPKGPISMDVNAILSYKNKIDIGLGLRNTDAVNLLLQYKFDEKFSIAYSMDYILSDLSNSTHFSHEFSLMFGSCKSRNSNTTVCPLF
jgi:type IX secretion system PorP/SprF family membrane protein